MIIPEGIVSLYNHYKGVERWVKRCCLLEEELKKKQLDDVKTTLANKKLIEENKQLNEENKEFETTEKLLEPPCSLIFLQPQKRAFSTLLVVLLQSVIEHSSSTNPNLWYKLDYK